VGGVTDVPADLTPLVLTGHVLDVLRALPENSVQCVVTSPPYWGLRAYGTEPQVWGGDASRAHDWVPTAPRRERSAEDVRNPESIQAGNGGTLYEAQGGEACACGAWRGELGLEPTPELYVSHLADVFDAVRRVLREDGTCWVNLGDSYCGGGRGSGIHSDGTGSLSSQQYWENNDKGQVPLAKPGGALKAKDLVGIPWRVAFELQRRGWWLRAECIWAKPNPMPESVTDRPTRAHEQVFLLTKSARYYYDADAVRLPLAESSVKEVREGYNGRATKLYAGTGAQDPSDTKARIIANLRKKQDAVGKRGYTGFNERWEEQAPLPGANLKSVWWIATQPYPEAHFATFPEALAETCIRAGTSERGACAACGAAWERRIEEGELVADDGGEVGELVTPVKTDPTGTSAWSQRAKTVRPNHHYERKMNGWHPPCFCPPSDPVPCLVLDPFAGSGTVLAVARSLGRRSIGIELKPEYVTLARERARSNVPDLERFADEREREEAPSA
jgi:DNA modification methylase